MQWLSHYATSRKEDRNHAALQTYTNTWENKREAFFHHGSEAVFNKIFEALDDDRIVRNM
jgi:hypothetical protein